MALYLEGCLEEGGVTLFLHGCNDVARAKGITSPATHKEGGNPTMDHVRVTLESLGFRMAFKPLEDAQFDKDET
jgi:DNA-binding phage protein